MNKYWLYIEFSSPKENEEFQRELIKRGWSWDGTNIIKNTGKGLLLKKIGWVKVKNSNKEKISYKRIRITNIDMVINTLTPFVFYSKDNELIKEFLEYKEYEYENTLFPVKDLVDEENIKVPNLYDNPIGKITFSYYSFVLTKLIDDRIKLIKKNDKWIW